MQLPWNLLTPVEALFKQLAEGVTLPATGGEALSDTQVICTSYNIINATGLFELSCHDWRQQAPATKKMASFQDHF
jgi:hypothetical protein